MIHLDTSFLIRSLAAGTPEDRRLRQWLTAGEPLTISALVWAEFLCGPLDSSQGDAASLLFPTPEPFLADDARAAADLFNQTGRRRGTLIDCMIAAIAMRLDASIITSNPADFRRFEPFGLRLV